MRQRAIIVGFLAMSACSAAAPAVDDPRCLDPRIGSVFLDDLDTQVSTPTAAPDAPAVGGVCDGSSDIRLVVVDSVGNGGLIDDYYLERYHGAFLVLDGKCHFYAFDHASPHLSDGTISAEVLAQLTADLRLDTLADLPSSKDTIVDHYNDTLIATPTHSLRCRDQRCRDTGATLAIMRALSWLEKLAALGRPSTGALRAFAFPVEMPATGMPDDTATPGQVSAWPLQPTLRSLERLVVSDSPHVDPALGGLHMSGMNAETLRELRRRAIAASGLAAGEFEPPTVKVRDCGQTYRLLLRDELPGALHPALIKLLDTAWKRPVITECVTFSSAPESVTPCPDD